ncbi:MAG: hypothetical protein AAGI01_16180, partial [Myxococcota bacterium]
LPTILRNIVPYTLLTGMFGLTILLVFVSLASINGVNEATVFLLFATAPLLSFLFILWSYALGRFYFRFETNGQPIVRLAHTRPVRSHDRTVAAVVVGFIAIPFSVAVAFSPTASFDPSVASILSADEIDFDEYSDEYADEFEEEETQEDLPLLDPVEQETGAYEREVLSAAEQQRAGRETYADHCGSCHNLGTTRAPSAPKTTEFPFKNGHSLASTLVQEASDGCFDVKTGLDRQHEASPEAIEAAVLYMIQSSSR